MANRHEACALHAGWRGVAAGIALRSKDFFQQAPLVALLGPHIQFSSFEVGRDVANELLKSLPPGGLADSYLGRHSEAGKVYFNLRELIAAQLRSIYPGVQILASSNNTLINRAFHSYRRNGPQAGRQYSFVVLKP
jgi:copper oxidase (laccase) domain-containing protein